MTVAVRRAEPRDFEDVTRLLTELGRPAVGADEREAAREIYERHVAREDAASLVAELNDEVVGFCSLEFRDRLNRTTPQAWVPDLVVTERHRSSGVGRALLAEAFEEAERRGCWSLTLESAFFRTRAHAFYEREGMQREGFFFSFYP